MAPPVSSAPGENFPCLYVSEHGYQWPVLIICRTNALQRHRNLRAAQIYQCFLRQLARAPVKAYLMLRRSCTHIPIPTSCTQPKPILPAAHPPYSRQHLPHHDAAAAGTFLGAPFFAMAGAHGARHPSPPVVAAQAVLTHRPAAPCPSPGPAPGAPAPRCWRAPPAAGTA